MTPIDIFFLATISFIVCASEGMQLATTAPAISSADATMERYLDDPSILSSLKRLLKPKAHFLRTELRIAE
jgi:hypothetical protein